MTRNIWLPGAALLAALALAAPTLAQGPGGFGQAQGGPAPGGQGGFGGRGGGQGGGFGRGGGGMGRPTMGSVASVDATAGTVTLAAVNGGQPTTIKVADTTPVATETTGTAADLKVGDQVQITGSPTALTITTGTLPDTFGMAGRFLTGGFGGGGGRGGFGGGGAVTDPNAASYSITNGKVVSVSPLTISAGSNVTVTLKSADAAKVNHIATGTLAGIKPGDQVFVMGPVDAGSGAVTATMLAVNFTQLQGGFGGRGGFGRGGGQGGGFGGQGRPRNRGGQGGNGQNNGGAAAPDNGGANAQVMPEGDTQ